MADKPSIRLNKVLRELNISLERAVEFLNDKGVEIDARPTTKITDQVYDSLLDEFEKDKSKKVASHEVGEEKRKEKESLRIIQEKKEQERLERIAKREELKTNRISIEKPKSVGKIDLDALKTSPNKEARVSGEEKNRATVKTKTENKSNKVSKEASSNNVKTSKVESVEPSSIKNHQKMDSPLGEDAEENKTLTTQYKKLSGPKKTGQTINLEEVNKKEKTVEDARKRKRKRISKDVRPSVNTNVKNNNSQKKRNVPVKKEEPSEEDVQKQIRETLEKLQGKSSKSKGAKYRRDKRSQHRQKN
jgi:translation initiation factor IF-2